MSFHSPRRHHYTVSATLAKYGKRDNFKFHGFSVVHFTVLSSVAMINCDNCVQLMVTIEASVLNVELFFYNLIKQIYDASKIEQKIKLERDCSWTSEEIKIFLCVCCFPN